MNRCEPGTQVRERNIPQCLEAPPPSPSALVTHLPSPRRPALSLGGFRLTRPLGPKSLCSPHPEWPHHPASCLWVASSSLLSEPSPTLFTFRRTFAQCLLHLWFCVNGIDLSVLFCVSSRCPTLGHIIDLPKPQRSYPLRGHNVGMSRIGSCEFSELIYIKQFPARTSFPCPQTHIHTCR